MPVIPARHKVSSHLLLGGVMLLSAAAIASFLALVFMSENGAGEAFVLAAIVSSILCSGGLVPLFAVYWRRLDEAAREAQKAAWLWGAPIGYAAFILILILPGVFQMGFQYGQHGVSDTALFGAPFMQGAIAAYISQLIGALVAWGIWWARKR